MFVYVRRGPSPVSERDVNTIRGCRRCACARRLSNTFDYMALDEMRVRSFSRSAVMLNASTPMVIYCLYLMYYALRGLIPAHAAIFALRVLLRKLITHVQKLWVFVWTPIYNG